MTATTMRGRLPPGTVVFLLAVGLLVLGVVLAGFALWEWTVWLLAAGLLLCSAARLVLTDDAAGLLRVRRRWIDVVACALLAVGIITMFLSLPSRG
jgi:Protein of unknown function (DUF3017)